MYTQAGVLPLEAHREMGKDGKGVQTHVSRTDRDSLMNHVHARDDHTHLPRPLEAQDVCLLGERTQHQPPEDGT